MLYSHHKNLKWKLRILVSLLVMIGAAFLAFLLWASDYYHAGEMAVSALQSDNAVTVEKTKSGWLFDGPSDDDLLLFYPGGKVEETAYAPLLHILAAEEMDVYLFSMPLRLAILGLNAADDVVRENRYERYYIGGHSLGGAMAAIYGAKHQEEIKGIILLAAYPTKKTGTDTLLIFGSEDGVLNMARVEEAEKLVSGRYDANCIDGGNHARFGDYGDQSGDGKAGISAQRQWDLTVDRICAFLSSVR
ncbi:MAG: alpha/beta fold hydrolase [Blautia sp.]|nr:alpha/beta fold hydrolase [Blautia sp.]